MHILKPVGLTRAEETFEEAPLEARIVASPGTVRCRISVLPNGDDCPAAATGRIVWKGEEDKTPACTTCTFQLQQRCPGAVVRVDPL